MNTLSSYVTCSNRFYIFLFFFLVAGPLALSAQQYRSEPVGMVNDFADILSSSEVHSLENKLRNYRDTTTTGIAIATITDLKGVSVDEAATTIFNDWKIWHEDQYNGVLILIAPNERKMRIEVGYGLEGAIPDIMAGRIIRDVLTPQFKKGNFYGGLDRATDILIDLAEGEFEGNISSTSNDKGDTASTIIFILFIIFVIYASSRKGGRNGRRRRTIGPGGFIWLGGSGFRSGGGSSFGGGGGGFGSGGGGASGGW